MVAFAEGLDVETADAVFGALGVAIDLEDAAPNEGRHFSASRACAEKQGAVIFTGRTIDDETRLMYFRARMYSVGLGRFVGRDPKLYIDGASLYGGFFVPNKLDYSGCGVSSSSDPSTHIGIPWSWVYYGSGSSEYGYTKVARTVKCTCEDCSGDSCGKYISCSIHYGFNVYINFNSRDFTDGAPARTYGHEQRHVKAYIDNAKTVANNFNSRADKCRDSSSCNDDADQMEMDIKNALDDLNTGGSGPGGDVHGHGGHPGNGAGEDPIGDFPPPSNPPPYYPPDDFPPDGQE